MRKVGILIIALSFGVVGWAGSSYAAIITDEYIGADPAGGGPGNSRWDGRDVVGVRDVFDIHFMDVGFSDGIMSVNISSNFFSRLGAPETLGTELGDLFVSIDGWNPNSTGTDYENDNFFQGGEDWEFVIDLDDNTATSGVATLRELNQRDPLGDHSDILLSEDVTGSGIFRVGQEVQYGGGLDEDLAGVAGAWAINDEVLTITIAMLDNWSSVSELGFHYAMSCGNDVIEGSVAMPSPEPSTMFLLGAGLIVMAGLGRRKLSNGQTEQQTTGQV